MSGPFDIRQRGDARDQQRDQQRQQGDDQVEGRENRVPEALRCPLSGRDLDRAVRAPDGQAYDEQALREYLDNHEQRAPNGVQVGEGDLRADLHIRELVEIYQAGDVPAEDDFLDPITMAAFEDPVVASDGRTYSLSTVEQLFRNGGRSPFTREPLSLRQYRSSVAANHPGAVGPEQQNAPAVHEIARPQQVDPVWDWQDDMRLALGDEWQEPVQDLVFGAGEMGAAAEVALPAVDFNQPGAARRWMLAFVDGGEVAEGIAGEAAAADAAREVEAAGEVAGEAAAAMRDAAAEAGAARQRGAWPPAQERD